MVDPNPTYSLISLEETEQKSPISSANEPSIIMGILKNSKRKQFNSEVDVLPREDIYGNVISSAKKHKIMWKKKLAKVHIVENWKEYNVDDSLLDADDNCCFCCPRSDIDTTPEGEALLNKDNQKASFENTKSNENKESLLPPKKHFSKCTLI